MAGIKSILLHLDATPASVARLEVTRRLAARHEARITALFAATQDRERTAFAYSASALLSLEGQAGESAHAEAKHRLLRSIDSDGPAVTWCDVVADSIGHGFREEASYADLLVVGRQGDPETDGAAPNGFVESMILESGRPTLVVPSDMRTSSIGRRVLVAWDGSLAAARALSGALPLLEKAEQVHVASWSTYPRQAPFSHVDVCTYLLQHEIAAQLHQNSATSRVAEALTSLASRLAADLVVMGCYGHRRLGERIFGGASRSVLAEMPLPLLMAH